MDLLERFGLKKRKSESESAKKKQKDSDKTANAGDAAPVRRMSINNREQEQLNQLEEDDTSTLLTRKPKK